MNNIVPVKTVAVIMLEEIKNKFRDKKKSIFEGFELN